VHPTAIRSTVSRSEVRAAATTVTAPERKARWAAAAGCAGPSANSRLSHVNQRVTARVPRGTAEAKPGRKAFARAAGLRGLGRNRRQQFACWMWIQHRAARGLRDSGGEPGARGALDASGGSAEVHARSAKSNSGDAEFLLLTCF
jgi:hypothetical protein